jgi:hypothetical protein
MTHYLNIFKTFVDDLCSSLQIMMFRSSQNTGQPRTLFLFGKMVNLEIFSFVEEMKKFPNVAHFMCFYVNTKHGYIFATVEVNFFAVAMYFFLLDDTQCPITKMMRFAISTIQSHGFQVNTKNVVAVVLPSLCNCGEMIIECHDTIFLNKLLE